MGHPATRASAALRNPQSGFRNHIVLSTATATLARSRIICSNTFGVIDCAPSVSACSGSGWTSIRGPPTTTAGYSASSNPCSR